MGFREFTAAASAESRSRTTISAAGCSREGALLATTSYPDRTSPVLRGKWLLNNIFGLPIPPPPPGVDTNLRRPSRAPRRRRYASGWRNTGRIPRATVVIRSSIRWGLRWRISTSSADGGPMTKRASRSTRAAPRLSGAKIEGLVGTAGAAARAARAVSRAPSPKNFWPTRSAEGSSTTIGRR